jgi:hypothetical protein
MIHIISGIDLSNAKPLPAAFFCSTYSACYDPTKAMSATETYSLAHTARCKLQLAADTPDRNLRFILGHAFTLDKLRLRIAEIEMDSSEEEEDVRDEPRDRRVRFRKSAAGPRTTEHKRSPPPDQFADLDGTDSHSDESGEGIEEGSDDEGDDDLSLRRFQSGAAREPQPQMIDDDSSSSEEEELESPPPMPSEDELRMITGGEDDGELADMYQHVAECPCHGQKGPHASSLWKIPQKPGQEGGRYAVVAVDV